MASQNQTGDALRPYTVSTRDLNGSLMTLTRASLAARAEERRLLEETLRDEDNNGLTAAECRRLIRIFRTEELPISYAEVWQDQRERDEGRVLMAQARLRATMAKQPPATSGSNEPEQESPQAADDGTDESQPDETLDPAGSSPNSSEEESESPQQAGESSEGAQPDNSPSPHGPRTSASAIETQPPRQVDETKRAHQRRGFQGAQPDSLPIPHGSRTSASAVETQPPRQADERKRAHQRRGFRHRSEPQEDWEKRMKRAPIMFRARRFEDPDCIEHDGPPSIFSIELDGEGNLVKVALDKLLPLDRTSWPSQKQAPKNPRKRQRSEDADEDADHAPTTTIPPQSAALTEAPTTSSSSSQTEPAAARPSGMSLLPGLGKEWGVRRRRIAESERRSEAPSKADDA